MNAVIQLVVERVAAEEIEVRQALGDYSLQPQTRCDCMSQRTRDPRSRTLTP